MEHLDMLRSSVLHTRRRLDDQLQLASAMEHPPDQPRKASEAIDTFLALTSRHLAAVDAVLLPAARRLPGGSALVHRYLRSARNLGVVLAHVKARAYGSVYDARRPWSQVWAEVEGAMTEHRRAEFSLAETLAAHLDEPTLDRLAERLHAAEVSAPTRPHPYLPHTGLRGRVGRRVVHAVDSFWDTAEGRMLPEVPRPVPAREGLWTQYLLGDPRFDEREP